MTDEDKLQPARDLLGFIDESPTPYHAVAEVKRRLDAAGFSALDERAAWKVEPGTRAYVIRGGGTLVAFIAGSRPPAEAGFMLIGAHTDSPNLRVKPAPEIRSLGYRQLGVEVYGGVLLSTWLDRDLSLAGRVSVRGGGTHLVRFTRPLCRIPNLAIHLNRDVNSSGLVLNAQTHLMPVLAVGRDDDEATGLRALLAEELGRSGNSRVAAEDVLGWDLCLYDTQPASLGGAHNDLLFAPRLDNLASCHAATQALLGSGNQVAETTRAVALYDHEEVGSQSAAGARSRFLLGVLERVAAAYGGSTDAAARALSRSLLLSADMAHAIHPNYGEKHDKHHAPRIGRGPVLKVNANQSYATDGPGTAVFTEACQAADFTPQRFVSRNDMPCGSTIGPISAARMAVRTLDVGNPMLGMHSCRETAGARDVAPMIAAMTALLSEGKPPDPAS